MKQLTRQLLKLPLVLGGWLSQMHATPKAQPHYTFLIYHSVGGALGLELDLGVALFRRQLAALAPAIISYDQALTALQAGQHPPAPRYILTFDDGYDNFYTHVYPLLQEHNTPATLFVTTGFVEEGIPYPIQRHQRPNVRPVTWEMLAQMAASGLVTLGAHTHTHPDLTQTPPAQAETELTTPIHLFQSRLGHPVAHFAYPKARWTPTIEALVAHHYRSAVIAGSQPARPDTFHPHRIPRLPIRHSDGWWFFQAKLRGWLADEERLYDALRHIKPALTRRPTHRPSR